MKVICLTGGLASGKSTAVKYLAEKGAAIIDADVLGHRAYDPGTPANDAVVAAFGEDVRNGNGEIDRRVLGSKVFGKPEALKQLTDIVWPEIRRMAEAEISNIREAGTHATVVLEAAVLFEAGWEDIGDEIWVITVDRETAIARAMARDGADRESVERRLDSQLTNEERTRRADVVISNDDGPEEMLRQLDAAYSSAPVSGSGG